MNTRVNMLYFIEVLCELSLKADYTGYVKMIQRDLLQIVDTVVPNDPEGAANVGTVRKVCLVSPTCTHARGWMDWLTLGRSCRAYGIRALSKGRRCVRSMRC